MNQPRWSGVHIQFNGGEDFDTKILATRPMEPDWQRARRQGRLVVTIVVGLWLLLPANTNSVLN